MYNTEGGRNTMKQPLHRSECSFPEEGLNSQQLELLCLSSTSGSDKKINIICPQHQHSEIQHRNGPLRRRLCGFEWNYFTAPDRCTCNTITHDEVRRISCSSCFLRNASFVLVVLCWMVTLPLPTFGEEVSTPTTVVIPRFRIEPIEFRGGVVIPAIFLIDDPEIDVTPAPMVVVTGSPTTKPPTSTPTRNPIATEAPVLLPPPTNTPANTFTPTITTIQPITASPTNAPIVDTDAPITNSPSSEPSKYPSHTPVRWWVTLHTYFGY